MSLHVERDGGILRLSLDGPRRNALDDASVAALIGQLEAAGQDDGVRVVTLSGTGDDFCSGFDLVGRNQARGERPRVGSIQRRLPAQAHRLIPLVLEVQVPVVCVVRGWAAGIGFQLALAEIDAHYARERARGSEPRWWDDVEEGDEVGPLVKGPLTVTDMICWHVGMGMGLYGVKPLRLGWRNRLRVPRFFHKDDLGVPDVLQRVHWDPAYARKAGNPTTFDYGRMRETWLIHLCTDWMGDDAWLWKLDCQFRRFNYVGDTHWMRGRVIRKTLVDGDRPAVELDLAGENQRGEVTTPGHATILLPSREHGPVRLPEPPGGATTCAEVVDALVARFATEERT